MANDDNPRGFRWLRSMHGEGSPIIETAEVAASQTIAIGDALAISSGQVTIAASNSGAILGVAVSAVTVAGGATGTGSYIPALTHYVFVGQCSGTFAQSIMFTSVDIEGTTGIMEINENATTEAVVRPIALANTLNSDQSRNSIGANSDVEFVFVRSEYTGALAAV